MAEIILVRPGQTDFDEQNRIQGLLDLPFSERGRLHASQLLPQLRSEKIDVILSDPGEPARSTAQQLGDLLDIPVKEKSELHNLDQGLWQGLQLDEIRRKYPKLLKQWHEHPETICPPGGETVCEAMKRIAEVLKKPRKKYKRILIVAADPLATLIGGMLRGAKAAFHGPMCSHSGCNVEWYSDDVEAAVPLAVNGHGRAHGQNGNGNAMGNGNGHAAALRETVSLGHGHGDGIG